MGSSCDAPSENVAATPAIPSPAEWFHAEPRAADTQVCPVEFFNVSSISRRFPPSQKIFKNSAHLLTTFGEAMGNANCGNDDHETEIRTTRAQDQYRTGFLHPIPLYEVEFTKSQSRDRDHCRAVRQEGPAGSKNYETIFCPPSFVPQFGRRAFSGSQRADHICPSQRQPGVDPRHAHLRLRRSQLFNTVDPSRGQRECHNSNLGRCERFSTHAAKFVGSGGNPGTALAATICGHQL